MLVGLVTMTKECKHSELSVNLLKPDVYRPFCNMELKSNVKSSYTTCKLCIQSYLDMSELKYLNKLLGQESSSPFTRNRSM